MGLVSESESTFFRAGVGIGILSPKYSNHLVHVGIQVFWVAFGVWSATFSNPRVGVGVAQKTRTLHS